MAEYSDGDAQYARRIVDRLLSDERPELDIDNYIVIYDLQRDAAEFSSDLALLKAIGADMPAIRISEKYRVPISLSTFARSQLFGFPIGVSFSSRHWRHSPYFHELRHELILALRGGGYSTYGNETMSREEARSTFADRASDFLATRIAAVKAFGSQNQGKSATSLLNILQKKGGARVATPGCNFSISTNSPGLRVFWSGAYRISSNYFSHPTTPATSVLQSGTYVFGVNGGAYGNAIQWDTGAVVTLPGPPQAHLNY